MAFVEVMEKFSLSAIMASMVPDHDLNVSTLHETTAASPSDTPFVTEEPPSVHRRRQQQQQQQQQQSLSLAFKSGTAASHIAAESVHFVSEFIKGNVHRNLYSYLVLDLYHIYSTLESELQLHAPHVFPQVYFPRELNRTESLLDDVEFFHGLKSRQETTTTMMMMMMNIPPPTQAARDYQDRLRYIAKTEPLLLLSHAYTRYLGDLSGGRILARVARRAMNLPRDTFDGLRFYEFEHISSPKLFKDHYRQCLDDMEFSHHEVERLVAEANVAFVLNMRVFEEFDVLGGIPGAKVRPLEDALVFYDECIRRQQGIIVTSSHGHPETTMKMAEESSLEDQEGLAKCPFAFMGGPNPHALGKHETTVEKMSLSKTSRTDEDSQGGRCPWPFIFFHDPATGLRDYQTWIVLGLILCYLWNIWFVDREGIFM